MGRKSLPDPNEKSRPYWGFVEMVTTNADHVKNALKGGENCLFLLFLLIITIYLFFVSSLYEWIGRRV